MTLLYICLQAMWCSQQVIQPVQAELSLTRIGTSALSVQGCPYQLNLTHIGHAASQGLTK